MRRPEEVRLQEERRPPGLLCVEQSVDWSCEPEVSKEPPKQTEASKRLFRTPVVLTHLHRSSVMQIRASYQELSLFFFFSLSLSLSPIVQGPQLFE